MSTTPPAATAQRLLISFLLAAVVFEGWAIYGLSRRMSRLEARSGLGLAALSDPDNHAADRASDRGAPPPDVLDRQGKRDMDRPQGRGDMPADDLEGRGERPADPSDMPGDLADGAAPVPREQGEPGRGKPEGRGLTLERLALDEKYVQESLDDYLGVTSLDEATVAGLRAEVARIFDTHRAHIERGPVEGEDPEAREAHIEAEHERSTQVFNSLLGEDEARVFIDEVLRPPPRERRTPPPPDQGER